MSEESDLLLSYEKNIQSFNSSAHFLSLNGERIGVIDWNLRKREKELERQIQRGQQVHVNSVCDSVSFGMHTQS